MKLNIYEKRKIVKTYTADTYDLMYGTITDIANVINLDDIKTGSNEEILRLVVKLLPTGLDSVNNLLKDIFDGLTDEELKHVKVKEIAQVLVDVVVFTYNQLRGGDNSKN